MKKRTVIKKKKSYVRRIKGRRKRVKPHKQRYKKNYGMAFFESPGERRMLKAHLKSLDKIDQTRYSDSPDAEEYAEADFRHHEGYKSALKDLGLFDERTGKVKQRYGKPEKRKTQGSSDEDFDIDKLMKKVRKIKKKICKPIRRG